MSRDQVALMNPRLKAVQMSCMYMYKGGCVVHFGLGRSGRLSVTLLGRYGNVPVGVLWLPHGSRGRSIF
jgi:hypothetical protein